MESVLNPVVLTLARWMCGRSASLAGTASIIKPPKQATVENSGNRAEFNKHSHLPLHNDTHGIRFTWHGAIARSKPGLRISLVLVWARAFMKQVNQWREGGISPELIERFPELHTALGMDSAYPAPSTGESPLNERVEPFMKLGQDKFA